MNINKIRSNSLISIYQAESGHPGGVLSSIDLIAYLFMKKMNYDKKISQKKKGTVLSYLKDIVPQLFML